MAIKDSIFRLTSYYRLHGFSATLRRAGLALRRGIFSSRMIVFYCDLAKQNASPVNTPRPLRVERLRSYSEVSAPDLQEITSFWNPKQAHRNILERFEKGASLWLIRSDDNIAGYSWTIRGRAIAPYYFPLAQDDVQLFDFYVFPKFRGRAILWFLVAEILQSLKVEGVVRVFGDVAEWNKASLSFYRMTPFQRLGSARTFEIFGCRLVNWLHTNAGEFAQQSAEKRDNRPVLAKSHDP